MRRSHLIQGPSFRRSLNVHRKFSLRFYTQKDNLTWVLIKLLNLLGFYEVESLDDLHFYRLQRSCGEVIRLHLSVIMFIGGVSRPTPRGEVEGSGREGCLPGVSTQGLSAGGVSGQREGFLPRGCLPRGVVCLGVSALGVSHPQQCILGYGQKAGSMHPTGMHSSWF